METAETAGAVEESLKQLTTIDQSNRQWRMGGQREVINFVKSNRIENIDVNLIWTSLLIINVILLHPQHFNWTIILPQEPGQKYRWGLQVHGCLNKTQPNSRELRRIQQGRAGWHRAPNICHLWPPLFSSLVSTPVEFLVFLSRPESWGRTGILRPASQWRDDLQCKQIEGLKPTIIIILPHHSQPTAGHRSGSHQSKT